MLTCCFAELCSRKNTGTWEMENNVMKLDIEVDKRHVEPGAREILKKLRPGWKTDQIKFLHFTEGITNTLVGCQQIDDKEQKDVILVRVYGNKTDLIIDRQMEMLNMIILHKAGLAQPLYGCFKNGICYGFETGVCLDEKMVRQDDVVRCVTKTMAQCHHLDAQKLLDEKLGSESIQLDKEPCLFKKLRKWLDICPMSFPEKERDDRLKKEVMSKERLAEEIIQLEQHLTVLGSSVCFTHNDILLKNVVFNKEKDKATFIDYEYGGYNFAAYDIGNHFCEFAGMDTVDYSLYPERRFQLKWLRLYLEFSFELLGRKPSDVTDRDVEILYVQANKFALAANFFWGLWALIQARYSSIDFDYLDYGIIRFNEYLAKKKQFLSLQMPQ